MQNIPMPLVSCIIPCYNQGQYVYDAVASAYVSYSGECEVIVIDDASPNPQTRRYLDEVKSIFPVTQIIHLPENKGLSGARNFGIQASSGDFIQLLDADDLIVPGKVDVQVAQMNLSRNVDVSVTDYLTANEELTSFNHYSSIEFFNLGIKDFLYKWERGLSIPIHSALFRRDVILANLFNENAGRYGGKEDWYFWCVLAYKKHDIVYLNKVGAIYRMHPFSWTKSDKLFMGKSWIMAAVEIDKLVKDQEPKFLDSAVSWYKEYYSPHNLQGIEVPATLPDKTNTPLNEMAPEQVVIPRERTNIETCSKEIQLTILIPVYNHYQYLPKCLNSALSQLTDEVEIVCINDGSTDPRVTELLDDLAGKSDQLRILQNSENIGIANTTNKGVEVARGEYIAFLDCDDYLAPGSIRTVLDNIKRKPEISYFFSDRVDIDENGHYVRKATYGGYKTIKPSGNIAADLMKGMVASHLKVVKRFKFLEVGGCVPLLSGVQDWDMALKISETGSFFYIQEPLYFHRVHSTAVTSAAKPGQFRKTNIARRNFFAKRFEHTISDKEIALFVRQYASGAVNLEKLKASGVYVLSDDYAPVDQLIELWSSYKMLIYDARKDFNFVWTDFIKEYNSFFDVILCTDPKAMTSILPYLWNPRVIYYPWKTRALSMPGMD